MDEEPELGDAVGEPRRRPRVVRIRVDGDRAAAERRRRRLAGRALVVEAARRDDDELGPPVANGLPRRRVRRGARSSEHVAAAGESDHLRDPVAGGEGRIEPLGDEHRPHRCPGHALADGGDLRLHLRDDGPALGRHAQQFSERDDPLLELGQRVRV